MSEETKKQKETQEDFEAKQNLVGFFALLLEVDKRIHPENYKNNEENYAGYSNNGN